MDENEFLLNDRIAKIQSVIRQYGEEKFYLSFSGGQDSTVLHYLLDMALPGNKIPRVYANTGIEYNEIIKFVRELQAEDDRIVIIKPSKPIKKTLEEKGYPFKSKWHSRVVEAYQNHGLDSIGVRVYLGIEGAKSGAMITGDHSCPKMLRYQFEGDGLPFKVSQRCCSELKKKPIKKWEKENGNRKPIIGLLRSEGGSGQRLNVLHLTPEGIC